MSFKIITSFSSIDIKTLLYTLKFYKVSMFSWFAGIIVYDDLEIWSDGSSDGRDIFGMTLY